MTWKCYDHAGPCKLLEEKDGIMFEQHGNSRYRWWEIYDSNNFKFYAFKKKKEAKQHYDSLIV